MIKLIAVDVDGTFLRDDYTFDKVRFTQLLDQLIARDIQFVFASGNTMTKLKTLMPEYHDRISYIANNGGYIMVHGEEKHVNSIPHDTIHHALDVLASYPEVNVLLCGSKASYLLDTEPQEKIDVLKKYFPVIHPVSDLHDLQETHYSKITFAIDPEHKDVVLPKLIDALQDHVDILVSGYGNIDLLNPNIHKARGLEYLSEYFDVQPEAMAAFGDNSNDRTMLDFVGFSYAMGNGTHDVKTNARYIAPTNNEDGVLTCIEGILKRFK